jgi:hypothetical protein
VAAVTSASRFGREERGLVGKLVLLWVVLVAVLVAGAFDAGAIVLARVRTADIAGDAAAAGAEAFDESGDRQAALRAALATVADRDGDVRVADVQVTRRGRVTVVVVDHAGTVLVGRFGLLEDLRTIEVTETAGP